MIRKLIEEYKKWGLTVNTQKTKYLCIGAKAENLVMDGNKEIKTYKKYKYLGMTLNREGTDDQEIRNKIITAKKIIACLNSCRIRASEKRRNSTSMKQ
jgi:hypothetical protein